MLATRNKYIKFMLLNLLGEAPMQTQAIAQNVERRQWVEQELSD